MSISIKFKSYDLLKFGYNKLQYYDGLLIKADVNLHLQMLEVIQAIVNINNLTKNNARILDIACGEGAFAKRLVDHGFHVDCSDIDDQSFKFKEICDFYQIDINSQEFVCFSEQHKSKYAIVVTMETIEHIENAWHYLRGLQTMCRPGGYIIISTPNIENPPSKTFFMRHNQFQSFTIKSFNEIGHINPLTEYEIKLIAEELRLSVVDVLGAGTHPVIWITPDVKVSLPWTLSNILLFPFAKKNDYSSCKIYILKNGN